MEKTLVEKHLGNGRILIVDVGAKGAMCRLKGLEDFSERHGFEPNPVEFDRLVKREGESVKLFNTAVAETDSQRTFYTARNSSYSSFLKPDFEEFTAHFGRMEDFPKWRSKIETVSEAEISCRSLDSLYAESGGTISLLKLDTQGTELEILRGARSLLEENRILVIKTEFLFNRVYQGQCVFSDLENLLKSYGFMIVSCEFYPEDAYKPAKLGFDKPRFGAGGDAVFALAEPEKDDLLRTSLVLASLGYLSEADHFLQRINKVSPSEREALLMCFSRLNNKVSIKHTLKRFLPPVLLNLLKRLFQPKSTSTL